MKRAWLPPGCLVVGILAFGTPMLSGPLAAQTMYRGYDVGPDYGRMIEEQQRRARELSGRMQQTEAQVVAQTMQNPDCQMRYQQFRAQGGQLSYPEFAYRYAATAGFTPDGIRSWNQNEAANMARERAAVAELRQAEQARGDAQQTMNDRFGRNLQEQGRTMQGNGTWIDPTSGQRQVLPYLGPQQTYTDPRTGNQFVRDGSGQYWVRTPNGQTMPMQAAPMQAGP